jgi:hypothetical protein
MFLILIPEKLVGLLLIGWLIPDQSVKGSELEI